MIASPDAHLLVPLNHPNALEIKCSAEVIKRVNPGCVLCRRPGCCEGRYYHIKPRAEGQGLYRQFGHMKPGGGLMQRHRPLLLALNIADRKISSLLVGSVAVQ